MQEYERSEETGRPGDWRRYRCPVCGHADGVVIRDAGDAHIRCSHCDARLTVHLSSETAERVSVQVSTDGSDA